MLAIIGVALLATILLLAGQMILTPPRMTDGKAAWLLKRLSPEDLGLKFEQLTFHIRDSQTAKDLRIAAWWIPSPQSQGRTILLIHGYADAKVGSIAWAPLLHSLGWNILAIDLRAHGESGGKHCTAAFYERHDVDQILNQFQTLRPDQTRRIALFGISLGAAVSAATAVLRTDLAAVILEGPYADFRHAVIRHADLFGMPGGLVPRYAPTVAEWLSAADFRAVRPMDMIPRIPCPVLVIHADSDPLMDEADARLLESALQSRPDYPAASQIWRIPDAGHVLGLSHTPDEYRRRLADFLKHIDSPPVSVK